jgi:hypothetical protein
MQEMIDALQQLWHDLDVQEAFEHRKEIGIPDRMEYFFGKMDFFLKHDYILFNDDLLRARIQSVRGRAANFQTAGVICPKVKLRSGQRT